MLDQKEYNTILKLLIKLWRSTTDITIMRNAKSLFTLINRKLHE